MPEQIPEPPNQNADLTAGERTKGQQTRQEIIQAAFPLFSRQGYHGTSMRQIASAAGIALGGIYNHFESKEEIFRAVSLAYHPIHVILPTLEKSQGETVEEVVQFSADQMYSALSEGQDFMNLMFIEVVEFKGKHFPAIFAEIFPRALGFSETLKQKRGKLREDISMAIMVVTFIGLMFAFFIFSSIFGSLANLGKPKEILHQIVDIYLHGILSRNPNHRTNQ